MPKWFEERQQRSREFRALLERRKVLDEKLAARREAHGGEQR